MSIQANRKHSRKKYDKSCAEYGGTGKGRKTEKAHTKYVYYVMWPKCDEKKNCWK